MADVLFINEEFFKKNISHKQSFDTNQVVSSIRLVQKTNLKSIISDPIYDDFQVKLKAATEFNAAEQKLFESIQLFLAVKVAEEMAYAAPTKEGDIKDDSHISYRNKSTLMEARIIRDINRDTDLLTLAQSGTEDFDDTEMGVQGNFYFG
jgi:hypothetical protein